ncbi:MAG TPA: hypothetical protein VHI13_02705 [Candidatus Kapabacteria bacterium]|nr:hypothetical protein [Candidatus Kapabacteria bacterium]
MVEEHQRKDLAEDAISRIVESLRDGQVDRALIIARSNMKTVPAGADQARLRLYQGFCCIAKLRNMTADDRDATQFVNLCEEGIVALQYVHERGAATPASSGHAVPNREMAVEALLLLGDLALAVRDYARGETDTEAADASQQERSRRSMHELYRWAIGKEKSRKHEDGGNDPFSEAYRAALTLYEQAAACAGSMQMAPGTETPDARRRNATQRSTGQRHAGGASLRMPRNAAADGRSRWLWATNMVLAEFTADTGPLGDAGGDPGIYLIEALAHALNAGAHPIGEGLWTVWHTGVAFDPLGCTLLASDRLKATRGETANPLECGRDADSRFRAVGDRYGQLAVLALRAEVVANAMDAASATAHGKHAFDAGLLADSAERLIARLPRADAGTLAGYAIELEWYRVECRLCVAFGLLEEKRSGPDGERVLECYLAAYDAASRTGDLREILLPTLRIGLHNARGNDFGPDGYLKTGLELARRLRQQSYIWQFEAAIARVYEGRGNCSAALEWERAAGRDRMLFHRAQMINAVVRQRVRMESEHDRLQRQLADKRAEELEELNRQVQNQNKELAARLGERAQLLEGLARAVRAAMKEGGSTRRLHSRVDGVFQRFSENDTGWREFDTYVEARTPEFLNELNERAPNLTPTERRICILIRDGVPMEDICNLVNRKAPKGPQKKKAPKKSTQKKNISDEKSSGMESWLRTLDRHRFNILRKLRSTGGGEGNENVPVRSSEPPAPAGRRMRAKSTRTPRKRRQQGMRLADFLRFFGNEPGDPAFIAAIRKSLPDISRRDLLLCRHLRRGFSDKQIAEYLGVTPESLHIHYRRAARALGVSSATLRDAVRRFPEEAGSDDEYVVGA